MHKTKNNIASETDQQEKALAYFVALVLGSTLAHYQVLNNQSRL